MKTIVLACLLLVAAVCADVTHVTADTWADIVASKDFALVEFFAPWCGHCKNLAPEYKKLAEAFEGHENVAVVDYDCTAKGNEDLPNKYGVQGFPTIKLFKKGEEYLNYEGERKFEAMRAWLNKKTGPAVITLKNKEDLDALIKKSDQEDLNLVVGFFETEDSQNRKTFAKVAEGKGLDDFNFAEMINFEDEASYGGDDTKDDVVLFRHFDDKRLTTSDFDKLEEFILAEGFPLVDEIAKAYRRLSTAALPVGVLFIDPSKDNTEALKEITEVAEKFKGKINFAHADGVQYNQYAKNLGVDIDDLPEFVLTDLHERKNYPYKDADKIDSDEIISWLQDVLDGKVKPFMRSQPKPESNDGNVKVVVGDTFEEIVMDDSKDVLLEFYAEWCGHCKKFAPEYEKLGEKLADIENLVIAKIDGSENDTPIQIQGFPTIVFFPKGKKNDPITYDGGRTAKDVYQFIKKHAVASKDSLKAAAEKRKEAKASQVKHDEL
jgi:protein disulfide-isomerase A1